MGIVHMGGLQDTSAVTARDSPMMQEYPRFARRRKRVFGKTENPQAFQPHRYCAWGCFSTLFCGRA
jgi:hypothetical protein